MDVADSKEVHTPKFKSSRPVPPGHDVKKQVSLPPRNTNQNESSEVHIAKTKSSRPVPPSSQNNNNNGDDDKKQPSLPPRNISQNESNETHLVKPKPPRPTPPSIDSKKQPSIPIRNINKNESNETQIVKTKSSRPVPLPPQDSDSDNDDDKQPSLPPRNTNQNETNETQMVKTKTSRPVPLPPQDSDDDDDDGDNQPSLPPRNTNQNESNETCSVKAKPSRPVPLLPQDSDSDSESENSSDSDSSYSDDDDDDSSSESSLDSSSRSDEYDTNSDDSDSSPPLPAGPRPTVKCSPMVNTKTSPTTPTLKTVSSAPLTPPRTPKTTSRQKSPLNSKEDRCSDENEEEGSQIRRKSVNSLGRRDTASGTSSKKVGTPETSPVEEKRNGAEPTKRKSRRVHSGVISTDDTKKKSHEQGKTEDTHKGKKDGSSQKRHRKSRRVDGGTEGGDSKSKDGDKERAQGKKHRKSGDDTKAEHLTAQKSEDEMFRIVGNESKALRKAKKYYMSVKNSGKTPVVNEGKNVMKAIGNCAAWVPDADSDCCTFCGKVFTVVIRRHHCRKCGGLLCGDCTEWRIEVPELRLKKPVRVCAKCFVLLSEDNGSSTLLATSGYGNLSSILAVANDETENKETDKGLSDEESAENSEESLPEDKEERLRIKCMREIVTTEKAYVEDLKIIVNVFYTPIKFTSVLTPEQLLGLFSNVESLLPLHEEVYEKIKAASSESEIGSAYKSIVNNNNNLIIYF